MRRVGATGGRGGRRASGEDLGSEKKGERHAGGAYPRHDVEQVEHIGDRLELELEVGVGWVAAGKPGERGET